MKTEIAEYSPTAAALAELGARFKGVVFDVTTKEGLDQARKGRAEIRTLRTSLEAKRVEIKRPALERCRLIDAEALRITAALLELETPIDSQIKKEEARKEEERAAKAKAEAERIERCKQMVDDISFSIVSVSGKPSSVIASEIETVKALVIGDEYCEFKAQAESTRAATLARLAELHAAAIAHEAEQERIKAERAELARLKAEQEERTRTEQARAAEEARKRAEEEAAARARIEAEQRESRAKIEAEECAAREARQKADAEAKAKRDAEEARIKVQREEVEAKQRAADEAARKVREELEAKAAAERKAKEEAEREARRQEAELSDGQTLLALFKDRFGRRREFSGVVKAIDAYFAAKESKQREAA